MRDVACRALHESISFLAFSDLFLGDIRRYRENLLAGTGLQPFFPLWGVRTADFAAQMLAAGIRATITCVDRMRLEPRFVGTVFDTAFLDQLLAGVDPCGENGEFHTVVWDGPEFANPIPVFVGDMMESGTLVFADTMPTVVT